MILAINPKNPQLRLIRKVIEILEQGGAIGYPTDTVYGLLCDSENEKAVAKIFKIKKRQKSKGSVPARRPGQSWNGSTKRMCRRM